MALLSYSSSRSDGLNLAVGFQPTVKMSELFPVASATIDWPMEGANMAITYAFLFYHVAISAKN
jgi:hypothetical protein